MGACQVLVIILISLHNWKIFSAGIFRLLSKSLECLYKCRTKSHLP